MLKRFIAQTLIALLLGNAIVCPPADALMLPKPGQAIALSASFKPTMLTGLKVYANQPFKFDFILESSNKEKPTRGHVPGAEGGRYVHPHAGYSQRLSPSTLPSDQGSTLKAHSTSSGQAPQGNPQPPNKQPPANKPEITRLIKYFLAGLSIPEGDLWVNLSPYEKNRIIPESLGQTLMGRDLLAQDYILKQITASLMHPDGEIGKAFWKKIYAEVAKRYGATTVPINTFNKVWIVPEIAEIYESNESNEQVVYITKARLKVMLEEDYVAMQKNSSVTDKRQKTIDQRLETKQGQSPISQKAEKLVTVPNIIREIILPALEIEINEGENFAQLRQIYHSLILAAWYKKRIKQSIITQQYVNQKKIKNLGYSQAVKQNVTGHMSQEKKSNLRQPGDMLQSEQQSVSSSQLPSDQGLKLKASQVNPLSTSKNSQSTSVLTPENIYTQYLQSYKKGVYDFIREEPDPLTGETIPRKYFSGGAVMHINLKSNPNEPKSPSQAQLVHVNMKIGEQRPISRDNFPTQSQAQVAHESMPYDHAMNVAISLPQAILSIIKMGIKRGDRIINIGDSDPVIGLAAHQLGVHYVAFRPDMDIFPISRLFQEKLVDSQEAQQIELKAVNGFFEQGSKASDFILDHSQDFVLALTGVFSDPSPESSAVKTLKEALRVLKPGGKIIIGTYGMFSDSYDFESLKSREFINEFSKIYGVKLASQHIAPFMHYDGYCKIIDIFQIEGQYPDLGAGKGASNPAQISRRDRAMAKGKRQQVDEVKVNWIGGASKIGGQRPDLGQGKRSSSPAQVVQNKNRAMVTEYADMEAFKRDYLVDAEYENGMRPFDLPTAIGRIIEREAPAAVYAITKILTLRKWMDENWAADRPIIIWQNMRLGGLYPLMTKNLQQALGVYKDVISASQIEAWEKDSTLVPEELKQARFILVKAKVGSANVNESESFMQDLNSVAAAIKAAILMIDHSRNKRSHAMNYAGFTARYAAKEGVQIRVADEQFNAEIQKRIIRIGEGNDFDNKNEALTLNVFWAFLNANNSHYGDNEPYSIFADPISWFDDQKVFVDDQYEKKVKIGEIEYKVVDLARSLYGQAIEEAIMSNNDPLLSSVKSNLNLEIMNRAKELIYIGAFNHDFPVAELMHSLGLNTSHRVLSIGPATEIMHAIYAKLLGAYVAIVQPVEYQAPNTRNRISHLKDLELVLNHVKRQDPSFGFDQIYPTTIQAAGIADDSFDFIVLPGVLDGVELDEAQKIITEVLRIIKPNGYILIRKAVDNHFQTEIDKVNDVIGSINQQDEKSISIQIKKSEKDVVAFQVIKEESGGQGLILGASKRASNPAQTSRQDRAQFSEHFRDLKDFFKRAQQKGLIKKSSRAQRASQIVNAFKGRKVLNIGLETDDRGKLLKSNVVTQLRSIGIRSYGVDPQFEEGIFGKNSKYIKNGTVQNLPFRDNEFDDLISMSLFDPVYFPIKNGVHRDEKKKKALYDQAAKEMKRVLRNGGRLWIDPLGANIDLKKALENNGFKVVEIRSMQHIFMYCINNKIKIRGQRPILDQDRGSSSQAQTSWMSKGRFVFALAGLMAFGPFVYAPSRAAQPGDLQVSALEKPSDAELSRDINTIFGQERLSKTSKENLKALTNIYTLLGRQRFIALVKNEFLGPEYLDFILSQPNALIQKTLIGDGGLKMVEFSVNQLQELKELKEKHPFLFDMNVNRGGEHVDKIRDFIAQLPDLREALKGKKFGDFWFEEDKVIKKYYLALAALLPSIIKVEESTYRDLFFNAMINATIGPEGNSAGFYMGLKMAQETEKEAIIGIILHELGHVLEQKGNMLSPIRTNDLIAMTLSEFWADRVAERGFSVLAEGYEAGFLGHTAEGLKEKKRLAMPEYDAARRNIYVPEGHYLARYQQYVVEQILGNSFDRNLYEKAALEVMPKHFGSNLHLGYQIKEILIRYFELSGQVDVANNLRKLERTKYVSGVNPMPWLKEDLLKAGWMKPNQAMRSEVERTQNVAFYDKAMSGQVKTIDQMGAWINPSKLAEEFRSSAKRVVIQAGRRGVGEKIIPAYSNIGLIFDRINKASQWRNARLGYFTLFSDDGKPVVEISPNFSRRYFDENGRWILEVDCWGNQTVRLGWSSEGRLNSVYYKALSGQWMGLDERIEMNRKTIFVKTIEGAVDQEVYRFYTEQLGYSFITEGIIPNGVSIEHQNKFVFGFGSVLMNIVAQMIRINTDYFMSNMNHLTKLGVHDYWSAYFELMLREVGFTSNSPNRSFVPKANDVVFNVADNVGLIVDTKDKIIWRVVFKGRQFLNSDVYGMSQYYLSLDVNNNAQLFEQTSVNKLPAISRFGEVISDNNQPFQSPAQVANLNKAFDQAMSERHLSQAQAIAVRLPLKSAGLLMRLESIDSFSKIMQSGFSNEEKYTSFNMTADNSFHITSYVSRNPKKNDDVIVFILDPSYVSNHANDFKYVGKSLVKNARIYQDGLRMLNIKDVEDLGNEPPFDEVRTKDNVRIPPEAILGIIVPKSKVGYFKEQVNALKRPIRISILKGAFNDEVEDADLGQATVSKSPGGIDLNSIERGLVERGGGQVRFSDRAMAGVSIGSLSPVIVTIEPLRNFSDFLSVK